MSGRNSNSHNLFDFTALSTYPIPAVFAHRGASRRHPDNTLAAFEAAIAMGVDGIELDIRRTRDGILVIHHNARPLRSSRRIANIDYEDVLRLAGRQGYHVPTLQETLELCAGHVALDIELKEPGYESEVVKLTRRHYALRHVAFTSFRGQVVTALRKAVPTGTIGLIVGLVAPGTLRMQLRRGILVRRLERVGADFVAPHRRLVNRAFGEQMHNHGLPMVAWTVNSPTVARRLTRRGVAAIISDVPDQIAAAVREISGSR